MPVSWQVSRPRHVSPAQRTRARQRKSCGQMARSSSSASLSDDYVGAAMQTLSHASLSIACSATAGRQGSAADVRVESLPPLPLPLPLPLLLPLPKKYSPPGMQRERRESRAGWREEGLPLLAGRMRGRRHLARLTRRRRNRRA
eukprot:jgi/Mesen1/2079/ME000151S01342